MLIVVVEGAHDLEFLLHVSRVLHGADKSSLGQLVDRGEVLLLPVGGSHLSLWSTRLAALALPEFHLFDRETEPETALRQQIVHRITARPGCFATLTAKRSLENYLHPQAIVEAGGPVIAVADDNWVAELVARRPFEARLGQPVWSALSRRAQRRLVQRAKRWLHRWATPQMTPELLDERDPQGEVRGWLQRIAERTCYSAAGPGQSAS
ncbi:MAG: ATP-dependent endonuclease [Pirellulales bacterium]